jgi:hypothetical protein
MLNPEFNKIKVLTKGMPKEFNGIISFGGHIQPI